MLPPAVAQVPSPRRNVVELAVPVPNLAVETVPDERFDAFRVVKFAPLTAPKEPDQVPEVIVPTVAKLGIDVIEFCVADVTDAAVPVVFWLSVGMSAATIALNVGAPAVPLGAARKLFAVLDAYGFWVSP